MMMHLLPRGFAVIPGRRRAFTILEVLVAATVFVVLLGFLLSAVNQTTRVWRQSTSTLEAFRSAREAFDLMTQRLSEATLNTYWAYQFETIGGVQVPKAYRRESDLHFITGPDLAGSSHAVFFQAPDGATGSPEKFGGMNQLLNDLGFYILYGPDDAWRPPPASSIKLPAKYRLIQLTMPAEDSGPFSRDRGTGWYEPFVQESSASFAERNTPIGENIIAVSFYPRRAPLDEAARGKLPGGFSYDSKADASLIPQPVTSNQLPPLLDVAMIVIDEASAIRLAEASGPTPPPAITDALKERLKDPAQLDIDLQKIGTDLAKNKIQYRIFRATIPINASKWSEN